VASFIACPLKKVQQAAFDLDQEADRPIGFLLALRFFVQHR
jgi:hypothetical protein